MGVPRPKHETAPAGSWRFLLLVTVLGGLLRAIDLGRAPLWLDENATFLSTLQLWNRLPDAPVFVQASNPLYYTLLWAWTQVAGDSAAALRSLSALAGTACIPLGAALTQRLGGLAASRIAAVLIALHPLQLHYSREARAYALWTLALLAATAALWGACVRGGRWRWALAAVAWLGAFGSHVFTAFALPASAAAVLWAREPRLALRRWFGFAACVAAGMAGYTAVFLRPVLEAGAGRWLRAEDWRPLHSIGESLWALLPAGAYPGHLGPLALGTGASTAAQVLLIAAAVLPLIVLPFALTALRRPSRPEQDWRPLAALAVVPLALEWMVSWIQPVFFAARYDLVSWGAITLWIALGVAALGAGSQPPRRARVRTGVTVLLALCAAVPVSRLLLDDHNDRWDERRALRLSEITRGGDLVITFSNDDDAMAHALHRAGFRGEIRPFPIWLSRQIAFVDSPRDLSAQRTAALARDAAVVVQRSHQTLAAGGRVFWLADGLRRNGLGARARLPAALEVELRATGLRRTPIDEPLAIDRLERF